MKFFHFLLVSIIFISGAYVIDLYNNELFFAFNCAENSILQTPILLVTSLADGFFIILFALLLYPYFKGRLIAYISAFIAVGIFIQLMKSGFAEPRPIRVFEDHLVCVLGMEITVRSFPSGHSAAAFTFVRFLFESKSEKVRIAAVIFGILAAISRVYVGAHFPLDVWVGSFIGFYGSAFIMNLFKSDYKFRRRHIYSAVTAATGLLIAALYLFVYPEKTEELNYLLDPLVVLFSLIFLYRFIKAIIAVLREKPGTVLSA